MNDIRPQLPWFVFYSTVPNDYRYKLNTLELAESSSVSVVHIHTRREARDEQSCWLIFVVTGGVR